MTYNFSSSILNYSILLSKQPLRWSINPSFFCFVYTFWILLNPFELLNFGFSCKIFFGPSWKSWISPTDTLNHLASQEQREKIRLWLNERQREHSQRVGFASLWCGDWNLVLGCTTRIRSLTLKWASLFLDQTIKKSTLWQFDIAVEKNHF